MDEPPGLSRRGALLFSLGIFAAAALLYAPTLGYGFVWDDRSILLANETLDDWSLVGKNLTTDFFRESQDGGSFDYWRPLVVLSHMVERTVFGERAWGFHLTNVLLHATVSVLVWLLSLAWLRRVDLALVAGVLFVAHPVHVEVVAWVSGRSDLLLGLFFLVALVADARFGGSRKRAWLVVSLAAFASALLSKEAAVIFPALVVVRGMLTASAEDGMLGRTRRALAEATPAVIVLAVYLWLRFAVVGVAAPATLEPGVDRLALFRTWWSAAWLYLQLLAWPATLKILHHVEIATSWMSFGVLAGLLTLSTMVWAGWHLRRRAPGAAFGLAALLACLAPLSNFLIPVSSQGGADFPVAERFLYVPSVGFCMFAGWMLAAWIPWAARKPYLELRATAIAGKGRPDRPADDSPWTGLFAAVLSCVLILAGAVKSLHRSADWRSDLSLFETAVRDSPESYLAHLNYAAEVTALTDREANPVTKKESLEKARLYYLEALRLAPGNYRVHYDLGNLCGRLGDQGGAERAYREALLLRPNLFQARINLGNLLAQKGDLEAALAEFNAVSRQLPRFVASRVNAAHVLMMLERPEEAIPLYEEALALEPGLVVAQEGLERARATAILERRDSG